MQPGTWYRYPTSIQGPAPGTSAGRAGAVAPRAAPDGARSEEERRLGQVRGGEGADDARRDRDRLEVEDRRRRSPGGDHEGGRRLPLRDPGDRRREHEDRGEPRAEAEVDQARD